MCACVCVHFRKKNVENSLLSLAIYKSVIKMHLYGYVKMLWIMNLINTIKVILIPLNPGPSLLRLSVLSNCGNVAVVRVG